jgi:NADP-dependent 3-hydroxy acid dehydrogenase YdfG
MTVFKNQVAVVTGASSGIGKATALSLAEHGATVCLVARRLEQLEIIASSSRAIPPKLRAYQADLSRDEDISHLTRRLKEDLGSIDILIHSAGVFSLAPIDKASVTDFERQYRTNVVAPYALTQALLPMLRSRHGDIVFINSTAGLVARAKVSQYAATKHALKAIADSLREEVSEDGIRVLSVYAGRTASPMQVTVHAMENKEYQPRNLIQPTDIASMIVSVLSLPRTAEVTEIRMRPFKRP